MRISVNLLIPFFGRSESTVVDSEDEFPFVSIEDLNVDDDFFLIRVTEAIAHLVWVLGALAIDTIPSIT